MKDLIKQSKQIRKACPDVDSLTFTIEDVPMYQLRELLGKRKGILYFSENKKRMCAQLTYIAKDPGITVFCYSEPVKVETHIVVDSVKVNE